jgi:hypothetical protein
VACRLRTSVEIAAHRRRGLRRPSTQREPNARQRPRLRSRTSPPAQESARQPPRLRLPNAPSQLGEKSARRSPRLPNPPSAQRRRGPRGSSRPLRHQRRGRRGRTGARLASPKLRLTTVAFCPFFRAFRRLEACPAPLLFPPLDADTNLFTCGDRRRTPVLERSELAPDAGLRLVSVQVVSVVHAPWLMLMKNV